MQKPAMTILAAAIAALTAGAAAIPKERLIAHRGASLRCPENTLAAYRAARDAGFIFECDLHLSTDGYVFMNHDWSAASVKAKTGIDKHATNLTWKGELELASAGAWAGERWKDEKYPLLDDVLGMMPKGRFTNFDVKIGRPEMAYAIVEAFKRHPEVSGKDCLFSIGDDERVTIIRRQLPDASFAYCTQTRRGWYPGTEPIPVEEMIAVMKKWRHTHLAVMWDPEVITTEYVRKVHEAGFKVIVWTINDPRPAHEALARGVDLIASDDPERLLEENAEPRVAVPATAAPSVDGSIGADEWKDAVRMEGLCVYRKAELLPADAAFMLKQDGERVYVAARCIAPPDGLVRKVMARPGNADAFADDCFELVFFDDVTAEKPLASHLIVNFNGAMTARCIREGRSEGWKAWETVVAKSTLKDGYWEFEASVPFADVGFNAVNAKRHAIRVCRNWWRADDTDYSVQTSWSQNDGPFLAAARAPRVEFRDDAPVVRCEKLSADDSGSCYLAEFSVFNPGREDQWLDAWLRGAPVNSQPGERREVFRVAPGERRAFTLKAPVLNDEAVAFEASFLKATVTSVDGWTPWYSRRFTFAPNLPRVKFRPKGGAGEASFRFAYFPSYDRARVAADVSNCRGREKVTALALSVRDAAGKELKRLALGKGPEVDAVVELPDLRVLTVATGREDYEAVLVAEGAPEIKASVKFKRGVFEWEGNRLGLSGAVPAPFTKVKSKSEKGKSTEVVSVVLRDHIVDRETGLWQQVTAAGKDVLARPMALVGTTSVRQQDGAAAATERSASQPLNPSTSQLLNFSTTWDVDGLCEWRLTLKPGHHEPMALEIPLKAEYGKLYHSCADGLRYNPAGAVPAGKGRVWDSSIPPRTSIIGTYLPYVWVGGPMRGIAVFGENDRGWVIGKVKSKGEKGKSAEGGSSQSTNRRIDESTNSPLPCQEIIREADGTVVLRLNLVQRAVDLTEERTIRLGLMATPVKPMPANWRSLSQGTLMASWFVYGVSAEELSPYDGKDTFLRKMAEARRTGKVDKDYLENYVRSYPSPWPEGSAKRRERDRFLEQHWRSGMNRSAMSHGTDAIHVFYTNPRAVPLGMPPGTTYADEWDRQQWTVRGGNREAGHAYDCDPVRSYQDYAAWWYGRMVGTGAADAIYWDNVFCQSDFNLVGTDAYRHECGDVQPASGIFEMRALIKRCATVMAEQGKSFNRNWVHMTNTAMAPICSFAGVNYDWEDTSGDSAIQERYTREYVLAASLGRRFGNLVGVMGYFACDFVPEKERDKTRQAWLHRTGTGACLVHEFEWRRVPEWQAEMKRLTDWGYRRPDTKVWNYWDEDVPLPVAITGGENAALVMAREGKALVIVSDWKNGGDYVLCPDRAALGLPEDFKARDFRTGAELSVGKGGVGVRLDRFDYAIVELFSDARR